MYSISQILHLLIKSNMNMLNKVAVTFADLYHQRISMNEVRPNFYFFLSSWS